MIIEPKTRGFICITSHPEGCAANVREQIEYVRSKPPLENPPKRVLVVGASTGYGLASRIVPAFGGGASTIGVFYEKAPTDSKTASAGFYNSLAFESEAHNAGLYAKSFNGDAFSDDMKKKVADTIAADLGQIDMLIYSLASPRREDPETGEVHKSVLKPTGETYTEKNLDTQKGTITEVSIEPATPEEIAATVKVMGGEDWKRWVDQLSAAGLLSPDFKTISYSYIGPDLTWPIYTDGTIGRAKEDLEQKAAQMDETYGKNTALVSVNKALVTQASSAIPVVPLYISLLYKAMKEKGTHEGCIEQIQRLFADHLGPNGPTLDAKNRIRIDDWEMDPEIQSQIQSAWAKINDENLLQLSDYQSYKSEFLKLYGFGRPDIDYTADTNQDRHPTQPWSEE